MGIWISNPALFSLVCSVPKWILFAGPRFPCFCFSKELIRTSKVNPLKSHLEILMWKNLCQEVKSCILRHQRYCATMRCNTLYPRKALSFPSSSLGTLCDYWSAAVDSVTFVSSAEVWSQDLACVRQASSSWSASLEHLLSVSEVPMYLEWDVSRCVLCARICRSSHWAWLVNTVSFVITKVSPLCWS